VLVAATAAPARADVAPTSKVDKRLTPKQLGFTMPGECETALSASCFQCAMFSYC
jgi:hypothetical protein